MQTITNLKTAVLPDIKKDNIKKSSIRQPVWSDTSLPLKLLLPGRSDKNKANQMKDPHYWELALFFPDFYDSTSSAIGLPAEKVLMFLPLPSQMAYSM